MENMLEEALSQLSENLDIVEKVLREPPSAGRRVELLVHKSALELLMRSHYNWDKSRTIRESIPASYRSRVDSILSRINAALKQ